MRRPISIDSEYRVATFRANRERKRLWPLSLLIGGLVLVSVSSLAFANEKPVQEKALCPKIILRGREIPDFSDVEKRLVCGDPKTPAWKVIPLDQAEYSLRNFLQ